jgi:hypothetical protein
MASRNLVVSIAIEREILQMFEEAIEIMRGYLTANEESENRMMELIGPWLLDDTKEWLRKIKHHGERK